MCRFLIFKSTDSIKLEHLLTKPAHSIINQSFDSRLRIDMHRPINGDGFGVGYYLDDADEDEEKSPCIYASTTPAWNNSNLARMAAKTKSKLVFAHVRASTSGAISEPNCHPFAYHTLCFMHNGGIPRFYDIKRKIGDHIRNVYFMTVQGSTDSEMCFALFLNCLEDLGCNPASSEGKFDPELMRQALLNTIAHINRWTHEAVVETGVSSEPNLLNFAVTDGNTILATRYISSSTEEGASLHYSTGTRFYEYEAGQYRMQRSHRLSNVVMIASEPLTFERSDWVSIPTNTVLTVRGQTVLIHPIKDEFFNDDPNNVRSSSLALSKGLASPIVRVPDSVVPPLMREGRVPAKLAA